MYVILIFRYLYLFQKNLRKKKKEFRGNIKTFRKKRKKNVRLNMSNVDI